jgi:hypothetical protein
MCVQVEAPCGSFDTAAARSTFAQHENKQVYVLFHLHDLNLLHFLTMLV